MTHVVSGKIRKAPYIKAGCGQDGQSKMYAIELSEIVQDYKTQEKTYTNYRAIFFAKTPNAQQFYDSAMAEGSFVVVSCEKLKTEIRQHEGKTYVTLSMENAKLEGANYPEKQQPQQNGGQQSQQPKNNNCGKPQGGPVQQNAPAAQQPTYNEPTMDFDDNIPF
jgi:hypothetical protein